MTYIAPALGLLAGVVGIADTIPYVRDTDGRRAGRPHERRLPALDPPRRGGLSPADVLMITLAVGGVIGWIVADEPVIATACVVAADLIGAAMMVPKAYRDPGSETLATFALASLSGARRQVIAPPGPPP